MAQYEWPQRGSKPWDHIVKAAIDAINEEGEATKAEVENRLSEANLNATIADAVDEAIPKVTGRPTAIIFGTSLEAQNGTGPDTLNPASGPAAVHSRGWVIWMNAYLGQRFRITRNAGVGGNTFAQMLARVESDVLAYPSDWVLIGGPANDIIQARSTAAIIADIDAIHDAIVGAGRRILQLTAPPAQNTGPSNLTSGQKATLDAVNAHINSLNGKRGVVVADIFSIVADPSTYAPRTGMAVDTVHYTEAAAHRIGRKAAAEVAAALPTLPVGVQRDMDARSIIGNASLASGTGWTKTDGAGGGTVTVAYPGGGQAFLTYAGYTSYDGGNPGAIYYLENVSGGRFAPGDVVQASVRFRWSGLVPVAATGACRPFLRIAQRNVDNSFGMEALAFALASLDTREPVELPETGEMVALTFQVTLGPNTDRLYVYLGWIGAASVAVTVSDVLVKKVA